MNYQENNWSVFYFRLCCTSPACIKVNYFLLLMQLYSFIYSKIPTLKCLNHTQNDSHHFSAKISEITVFTTKSHCKLISLYNVHVRVNFANFHTIDPHISDRYVDCGKTWIYSYLKKKNRNLVVNALISHIFRRIKIVRVNWNLTIFQALNFDFGQIVSAEFYNFQKIFQICKLVSHKIWV